MLEAAKIFTSSCSHYTNLAKKAVSCTKLKANSAFCNMFLECNLLLSIHPPMTACGSSFPLQWLSLLKSVGLHLYSHSYLWMNKLQVSSAIAANRLAVLNEIQVWCLLHSYFIDTSSSWKSVPQYRQGGGSRVCRSLSLHPRSTECTCNACGGSRGKKTLKKH